MELQITGRHAALTEQVKSYVSEKLEPLGRYNRHARLLEVVLDEVHLLKSVEVIAHLRKGAPVVVTAQHEDPLAAIDLAHDKLERVLKRVKEKGRGPTRHRAGGVSPRNTSVDGLAGQNLGRATSEEE